MKLAGFWVRAAAHGIDFLSWNLVEFALESAITRGFGLDALGEQITGVLLSFLIAYLYYVEVPLRYGTTPGKRIFRIYVVRVDSGEPAARKELVLRLGGYLFSYLAFGCGFLMVLFHPRKIGLHDLIGGTLSIRKERPRKAGS
jgi:uncharacterized RDD family membrane protein YckC